MIDGIIYALSNNMWIYKYKFFVYMFPKKGRVIIEVLFV